MEKQILAVASYEKQKYFIEPKFQILPEEIQEALLKEQISERHARTLLNIPDAKKQKEMLKKVIDNKMSVRLLEDEIKSLYPKEEKEETKKPFPITGNGF